MLLKEITKNKNQNFLQLCGLQQVLLLGALHSLTGFDLLFISTFVYDISKILKERMGKCVIPMFPSGFPFSPNAEDQIPGITHARQVY